MRNSAKGKPRGEALHGKRVVVIGGGTGVFAVLSGLRSHSLNLTAIVSMADDGGSSGVLRDEFGILPPGDVRRALVALSTESGILRELFNYRFENGRLAGHSFGNIFLSALAKIKGDFASAVIEASRVLNIRGQVLPVTLDDVRLNAVLKGGEIIKGEANIDIPKTKIRAKIEKVWLSPEAKINVGAKEAILQADIIIIGPGDLYTSLIPNLLVLGVPEAIKKSKAKKVYVCNLMTKFGETDGFKAEDFTQEIEKYLGKNVLNYAVFNSRKPALNILAKYRREKSEFIAPPKPNAKYILADLLDEGPFIRHNPRQKLAKVLISLL